jgi:hypothetical protein
LTLESGGGGQEWFASFRSSVSTATEPSVNEGVLRSSGASVETAICLAAVKTLSTIGDIESA